MAMQTASKCLDDDLLSALAQGRLHSDGVRAAEAHLAHCAECQRVLSDLVLATGTTQGSASDAFPKSPDVVMPPAGSVIDGRYRVEHLLGSGGMGSVLAATHLGLQQRVAIKVLKLGGQQAAARFSREGRTLAQLKNQHIVRVYDSGELASGLPFIVMEHLDGSDLARRMRDHVLSIHESVSYVRQACVALEAAHALGIVHRDLKPSNLFLVQQSGAALVKVLDFGISKRLQADGDGTDTSLTLTGTGDLIGSPRYMSPEQLQGQRELDARSDIWSLGVILYELLTGKAPFPQRDLASVAVAIATAHPPSPRAQRPEVPEHLQAIVMRCLHKNPAQRFQSAAALARALEPYDTPTVLSLKSPGRWLILGSVVCVLVIASVVIARHAWRADPPKTVTQHALARENPPQPTAAAPAEPEPPVVAPPPTAAAGSDAVETKRPTKRPAQWRPTSKVKPKPAEPPTPPAHVEPVRPRPGLSATPD